MRVRGQVSRFDEAKGYGFLSVSGYDSDIFFHKNDLSPKVRCAHTGTWLEFEVITKKGKFKAVRLTAPGAEQAKHHAQREKEEGQRTASTIVGILAAFEFGTLCFLALRNPESPFLFAGIGLFVLVNLFSLALFALDKQKARDGLWRVSESTLLLACFLGGWPAAWFTMVRLRHKTSKGSFLMRYALVVALHFLVLGIAGGR